MGSGNSIPEKKRVVSSSSRESLSSQVSSVSTKSSNSNSSRKSSNSHLSVELVEQVPVSEEDLSVDSSSHRPVSEEDSSSHRPVSEEDSSSHRPLSEEDLSVDLSASPVPQKLKEKTLNTKKKPKDNINNKVVAIASRLSRHIEETPTPIKKKSKLSRRKSRKSKSTTEISKITPYAFYVRSYFRDYRRKNPEEKLDFIATSKQCAKQWHKLPDEMKAEFYKMAARENDRLLQIHKILNTKRRKSPTILKRNTKVKRKISQIMTLRRSREKKDGGKILSYPIRSRLTTKKPVPVNREMVTVKTKSKPKNENVFKCRECQKSVKDLTKKKLRRSVK